MTTDIQSAAVMARMIHSARGAMLGLALGDSWPGVRQEGQPLSAGVATQLACATVDGVIRSLERQGRGLPPQFAHTTFTALQQWAAAQQIPLVHTGGRPMTSSWMAMAPGFVHRRGRATATVRALRRGEGRALDGSNNSLGAHAVVRTLPLGLLATTLGPGILAEAAGVAATTHGHPLASLSAPVGASLVWAAAAGTAPLPTILEEWLDLVPEVPHTTDAVKTACTAALVEPGDPERLQAVAPDRTAISALAGAVYAIASHPEPEALPRALDLAAQAPDGRSTAAIAGAVLGTHHGPEPLVRCGAAALELAWLCETLATDLAMQLLLAPLGLQPDESQWLKGWSERYPVT